MNKRPSDREIRHWFTIGYKQLGRWSYELTARLMRESNFTFRDSWLRNRVAALDLEEDSKPGHIASADKDRRRSSMKTFVLTCAQSNTKVHGPFLESLKQFCKHRNAELHISRYTYNKSAYGQQSVKPGTAEKKKQDLWYDDAIQPYISDESIQLAPDLVWCGELNVLPTMKFPLTQFKTYTRQDSAIVPHAKMSMESIPTMKNVPAKMLYTTGCVTQRNYIQKTAGQNADFHHVYGAMLVEIDELGNWWARQINAKNDGTFYDLTDYFCPTHVMGERRVAGITHGDIHWDKADLDVLSVVFDEGGVVDTLHPEEQHFHDILDFAPRNHHNINDPWHLHKTHAEGLSSVAGEFMGAGIFLSVHAYRPWAWNYVITSNHDQAIETWLRNPDAMKDPVNVRFWHSMNAEVHQAIHDHQMPRPFANALKRAMRCPAVDRTTIVHEDKSHQLRGIEVGLHGHLGPNGARGSPKNLRTVGKANTAHTHTAGICDGVYTAGLYGLLDMTYNKGLSSWSHSFVVTYDNGKRAIYTIKNGRAYRDNPRKECK